MQSNSSRLLAGNMQTAMQAPAASRCSGRCNTPAPDRQMSVLRHIHRSACAASRSHAGQAVAVLASSGSSQSACAGHEARQCWQNRLAGGIAAAALSVCIAVSPAAAAEPFLTATGAQGLLRDQEAELFRLREEKEGQVRAELDKARLDLEKEGRSTQIGKLCATPFGVDIVGITELVALIGALVGGVTARQRKNELERLNEQLRKINTSLRKQARAGTLYAPGLTYIPPGASGGLAQFDQQEPEDGLAPTAMPAAQAQATLAPPAGFVNGAAQDITSPESPATMKRAASMASMMSIDEDEMSTEAKQCLTALREGKRLLKEGAGAKALVHFEKALMLAKFLGNRVQERRAVRGLAAASRIQSQYPAAISHLQRVLEISKEMQDHVGDADAYGTIADIYTDMGDFDAAATYYDRYIESMNTDGPV